MKNHGVKTEQIRQLGQSRRIAGSHGTDPEIYDEKEEPPR